MCTLHRGGSVLYGILRVEVGHHASEAMLMISMLWNPRLWVPISTQIAAAPVQDFFEMLDSRPSQNNPPVAPTATDEDRIVLVGKKAA